MWASCSVPVNAIEEENCLPGQDTAEWDVRGAGDATIQGFATDISYVRGETVVFKINTPAPSYRIDIYRMGYYAGRGARRVGTVSPAIAPPQIQPACLEESSTGLIDCGNWSPSASWTIPGNAVSGIYFAKLVRSDTGGASHIMFVVRDDSRKSDILLQTSDPTWQAYNTWGGVSLYSGTPRTRGYKVSYNRPFITRGSFSSWVFVHEYPMVRWLESNAYDVSYFTGIDSDRYGAFIRGHKVFISVGHDEYWSGPQRDQVETARNNGVNLMFLSGNEVFWKTRWENSIADNESYRTLVCYKETHDGPLDPSPEWTGTWRDARYGGVNRPENALTGTSYAVDSFRNDSLVVEYAQSQHRFWRNTTVEKLQPGQTAVFPQILGYEWDEEPDNGYRPIGLTHLSASTYAVDKRLIDEGNTYAPGTVTHHLTLYRHASGALVFSAGTMQWPWGLDRNRSGTTGLPEAPALQQATVNLLSDMKVQPGALRPGLVPGDDPPTLAALSPDSTAAGGADFVLTVTGTHMTADTSVHWDGAARPTTFLSVTQLQAVISAGDISAPGTHPILVANAIGTSASRPFIVVRLNDAPTITEMDPTRAPVDSPVLTLRITGRNFMGGSQVNWNGAACSTTYIDPTQVKATVTAGLLARRGFAQVTVLNPPPGGGVSAPQSFAVALEPSISGLHPSSTTAGGTGSTFAVVGNGFAADSAVEWNGVARPVVFISSGELRSDIGRDDVTTDGVVDISVMNSAPGGRSNTVPFLIVPPALATASVSSFGKPAPNPWRANRHDGLPIHFSSLPDGSEVKIFTTDGRFVQAVRPTGGEATWDLRNSAGELVSSDYYLFLVETEGSRVNRGVLAIIR